MKMLKTGVVICVLVFLYSCGKYEDGPAFSLRTKKGRLTGEWKVDEINAEKPAGDIRYIFEKDGDFVAKITLGGYLFTDKGEWEWEDGKEEIEITIGGGRVIWEILRLTNKEFWFEVDNDKTKCEKVD